MHAADSLPALDDVPLIEAWIKKWSERRVLLPLAGGALRCYSPRLAEIRSLVVADGLHRRGLGRFLIGELLDEASREGLRRVFVLTRSPAVFERLGFALVPRDSLPQKEFVDCSTCRRRERRDELALARDLR